MGMRPTFDVADKKALDPLVDKTIGNAYETVEYVAEHMSELLALTPRETDTRYIESSVGLLGQTTQVAIPVDISVDNIRSSVVQLRDSTGRFYDLSSGYFEVVLNRTRMEVTLLGSAPLVMQNAKILWTIVFGVTNA